jgi:SMC interacting uncharacterized protein involved in chromosome segregation
MGYADTYADGFNDGIIEFKKKIKSEITATLKQEKSNIFDGHQDQDNLEGWIEALEYTLREIENVKISVGHKCLFPKEDNPIDQIDDMMNHLFPKDKK